MIRRAIFLLAMALFAPGVQAGVSSHAVSYEVKLPADAEKGAHAEGTGTYSLTKTCQGWTLGEVYQFGIEKAPSGGAIAKLSDKADRLEERLNMTEALDGSRFDYQARTRLNARNT